MSLEKATQTIYRKAGRVRWYDDRIEVELDPYRYPDQQRTMRATCDRKSEIGCRNYALILCLLDTGMRAGEIMALNVSDVNPNDGSIVVRRSKSRRPRVVFVGARALRGVLRYSRHRGDQPEDATLWATSEGKRLTYSGLVSMLRRRSKKAGVPAPMPHAFRRAFAILSLRNGADVYSLQRLMGHSDLQVLRRYLKQSEADLREAHRRTGPVDNLL